MIDVDGVVGRLMQLVEDANLTTCQGGSSKDGIAEMILRDDLRTTEGEENPTRLYLLERLVVQAGIAFERIMECPTVLGKGRRIENNQVILVASLLKELEGILAESLMTLVAREVELYVAVGEFDGLGTTVDRVHQLSPSAHGIE